MMRSKRLLTILVAALLSASMAGCGDVDFGQQSHPDIAMAEQAVTVVPEFQVNGTSQLPEELYLSELGLVISEIRLEPVTSDHSAVAYSTREPTVLEFDFARGETLRQGEPVKLPKTGRYLVGVRLEPAQTDVAQDADASLSMSGFVASDGIARVDPRFDGEKADGSPIPLPYDEDDTDDEDDELKDAPALPTQWTPFQFQSRRSVYFQLGDVVFEPGRQTLTFQFNVQDWALDLVEPILSAVENSSSPELNDEGAVDATSGIESTGRGAEMLFENASVRTAAGR